MTVVIHDPWRKEGNRWCLRFKYPPGPDLVEGVYDAVPGLEPDDWHWNLIENGHLKICFKSVELAKTFVGNGGPLRVI